MNGTVLGTFSVVVVILMLLFVFALWFNSKIEKLGPTAEGFAWLEVVIGVFVTLIAIGLLDLVLPQWNAFFLGLIAFAASGLPMSVGAYNRHKDAIGRFLQAMKDQ
jgi:hypothetical protein